MSPARTLTIDNDSLACVQLCNATTGAAAGDGFQMQLAGVNGYLYNYEAGPIYFGTSGEAQMTILSTGNVGIGTTTPDTTLDVHGSIHLHSDSDVEFAFGAAGHGEYWGWIYDGAGSQDLRLRTYDGAWYDNVIFFDRSTRYIHMAGAADVRLTLGSQGTAGNNDANWIRGNGTSLSFNTAAGDFLWEIGGTEVMQCAQHSGGASFGVGCDPRGDIHFSSGTGTSGEQWGFGGGANNSVFYIINEDNDGQYMSHGGSSWTVHSDERIKENIVSLGTVLPDLKNMRCVKYNRVGNSETKIGFIAQDWESKFSEVVDEDDGFVIDSGLVVKPDESESTTKIKSISYTETIPVLLKAIQELEARIAALEA
jgi:hypothetical protein